jgi:hypothetical protein
VVRCGVIEAPTGHGDVIEAPTGHGDVANAGVPTGTRREPMSDPRMMTYEEQEQLRQDRLGEVGTEPPFPSCGRARVKRSDYTRCNPCGLNWLKGEDLTRDPRLTRMMATGLTRTEPSGGAPTAKSTTKPAKG